MGCVRTFHHVPGDARHIDACIRFVDEIAEAGLQRDNLVGVEGLPLPSDEMAERAGPPFMGLSPAAYA